MSESTGLGIPVLEWQRTIASVRHCIGKRKKVLKPGSDDMHVSVKGVGSEQII